MPQVLIVSSDADYRAVASRVLQKAGHDVVAVPHAGHALIECIQRPTTSVLVINDEGTDGPASDVARRLKRYSRNLRVVSMCDRATVGRGDASVVRPFTADDLLAAIEAACAATEQQGR
jgi:DNA-binding response OmpR family regulator